MKKIILILLFVSLILVGFVWMNSQKKTEVHSLDVQVVEEEAIVFTERYSARVDRVDVVFEQKDYTSYRLTTNELVREGELNTERGFGDDPDATVYILNWQKPEGERMYYVRLTSDPDQLFALDADKNILKGSALTLED